MVDNTLLILQLCSKNISEIVNNEESRKILEGNSKAYKEFKNIAINSLVALSMYKPDMTIEIFELLHSLEDIIKKIESRNNLHIN